MSFEAPPRGGEGGTVEILKDIRVIDLTMWAFVPAAGCILAHWGADVVKVENPRSPDPMRGMTGLFQHYNRGKRAMGINLASEEGRDVLYTLVETADVFLTSYLPETRRKLKVDVPDIRERNPKIIYAKGSGQGPRGPEAERGGYDGASWWARGSLSNSAMQGSGAEYPPPMVGHGDGMSGLTLAGGICAALLHRALTGATPVVDGSLMGAAMWFNGPQIMGAMATGTPGGGRAASIETHEAMGAGHNQYRTKDGRWISLHLLNDPDDLFFDMAEHLGRPEWVTDPRFSSRAARAEHNLELVRAFDAVFAERTLEDWKKALITTKGVWAPVQTAAEVHTDPQTIANGFIRTVEYPDGPVSLVVPPVLFDEEAGDPERAPDFCEHTDEVLLEAGFGAEDIARFRKVGAVG
jgi:crotonobetainyl-CoA:carnitine CoA-transferase CaiB-like acyl-CoA transferase